jgi:type IV pilus assembly protein PilQ
MSLDMKDADVRNVLRLIADVGDVSIVVTSEVEGKVTMHFSEMPWDAVLDAVLRSLNLGRRDLGDVIRVSSLPRLREEEDELKLAADSARALEPLFTDYHRLKYAKAPNLAGILQGGPGNGAEAEVPGLLSPRGIVVVDVLSNTMIVRDVREGIESARELVRHLDVPASQVLIEASIVETAADFGRSLGVQWGYRASIGPQTGHSTGANFPGTIDAGGSGLGTGSGGVPLIADFPALVVPGAGSALDLALGSLDGSQALDLRLTALEREGKARIISRPRIVTVNNVAATIKSLTVLRVKLPSTDTIIGGEGSVQQSTATERIETGIILVVTPQVSSDGFVLLDLFAKSSHADFTRTVDGIPTETSREANSHVLVRDGQTVVLGGIYAEVHRDEEAGMPFLRDLPGLGWLFQRDDKSRRREDLLVFLTPHVLGAGGEPLPSGIELWQDRHTDNYTGAESDAG